MSARRELGQVEEYAPGVWHVRLSAGHDPLTGQRRRPRATVKGSRKDAERKLAEMLAGVGRAPATTDATLAVFLNTRYLPWAQGRVRPATYDTYRHELLVLAEPLHHLRLDEMDPWSIETWLGGLKARGLGGYSRAQAFRSVRRALRRAVAWGMVPANVTDRVEPPESEAYEPTILTIEQAQALLTHFRGHRLDALVHLALGGGMRKSEMLGLDWALVGEDSVRVEQGWHGPVNGGIQPPKSKTSRRTVYLPTWSIAALERQWPDHAAAGWVFTEDGRQPWNPTRVSGWFAEHALKIGVTMPLKDLRHSSATLLLEAGTDLLVVSQHLGHSSTIITQKTYVKPRDHMRQQAVARLESLG